MSAEASLWSSEAWSSAADAYLLAQAREGSAEAYGELWRRHLPAAYAVATRHRGRAAPEDIVAEASARIYDLIQRGKGPEEHFRAYFLSTVRTVATDHARRDLRVVPAETEQLEVLAEPVTEVFDADEIDADLVREAFAELSERDQRVLWHTTVEGEAPRTVAPQLGLSANAVSARAMRAREALRARYLDAHAQRSVGIADSDECRWAIQHLGAHVRGQLPKRKAERVRQHLQTCSRTAEVVAELEQIRSSFPALLVPLVLLAGVSTPGFVSAGALGALGGAAATGGLGASGVSQPPSSGLVRDLTSHLTSVAAGLAIGVGVAGAGAPVPAAPVGAAPPAAVAAGPLQTVPPGSSPGASVPPAASAPQPSSPGAQPSSASSATPPPAGAAVRPPQVVRPPAPQPSTSAVVTRPAAPAPSAGAPLPTAPPTTPRPTTTASRTSTPPPTSPTTTPAPTTTEPPPPTRPPAPTLAIVGEFKKVGHSGSIVEIRVRPASQVEVEVTLVVTTTSGDARLEARNQTYRCEDGRAGTMTCTGMTKNAPLRVAQSGVQALEPVIVTATTADGQRVTRTIQVG